MTVKCIDCEYSKFKAGLGAGLAELIGAAPHPYPTHTCTKYGVTRQRDKYYMRPLPQCVADGGGKRKIEGLQK